MGDRPSPRNADSNPTPKQLMQMLEALDLRFRIERAHNSDDKSNIREGARKYISDNMSIMNKSILDLDAEL